MEHEKTDLNRSVKVEKESISSLEIAEITGKDHKNVLRDIRAMVESGGSQVELSEYMDERGKKNPCYLLNKRQAHALTMRYDKPSAVAIAAFFDDLEDRIKGFEVPQTMGEALRYAADLWDQKEKTKKALIEAERKNAVLMHVSKTYTATEIAKELGLRSAQELNEILQEKGIQYKQNGTWVPYADYSEQGYFEIKQTVLDNGHVEYFRRITQDGRRFILDLLKLPQNASELPQNAEQSAEV